jgi:hypothetical protein
MKSIKQLLREALHSEDFSKVKKSSPYKVLNDYKFIDEHMNHHHGQDDLRVTMYDKNGNEPLAKVDYTIYQGEINITFIESIEKGKGYGKILMIYLAKKYGYENLERTSLTQSGANMRAELDDLFDFNYVEYKKSQTDHLDINDIKNIKDDTVKGFMMDMVKYGYDNTLSKWIDYLISSGKRDEFDFNDIAEMTEWFKDSKTNRHDPEDEVPEWVIDGMEDLKNL